MKKNTRLILFSLTILIFLICTLISAEVFGIDIEQDYDSDFGKKFVGEYYIDTTSAHSALFCNKHGMPFFNKRDLIVKLDVRLWNYDGFSYSRSFTPSDILPVPEQGAGNATDVDSVGAMVGTAVDVWTGGQCDCLSRYRCIPGANYELTMQTVSCTAQANKAVKPQIGTMSVSGNTGSPPPPDEDGGNWYSVYSTGPTLYKLTISGKPETNNKIAYLLAQANANKPGLMPSQSQANWAWWKRDGTVVNPNDFAFDWDDSDPNKEAIITEGLEKAKEEALKKLEEQYQDLLVVEAEKEAMQEAATYTPEQIESMISQLEAENATLEAEIPNLEAQLTQLRNDYNTNYAQQEQLNREIKQLMKEIDVLDNKTIPNLERRKNNEEERKAGLEAKIEEFNQQIIDAQNEISDCDSKISELYAEKAMLEARGEDSSQVQKEIDMYETKKSSAQTKIETMNTKIANYSVRINSREQNIQEKQAEIDAKRAERDAKEQEQLDKESQYWPYAEKVEQAKQQIQQVEQQLSTKKSTLSQNKTKIESYKKIKDSFSLYTEAGMEMTLEEYLAYMQDLINKLQNGELTLQGTHLEIDGQPISVPAVEEIMKKFLASWSSKEGYAGDTHEQMLSEANTFEKMHEALGSKGNKEVNYGNSVKDNTDYDNVKVTYDSVNQQYVVGPFNIEYMEVYSFNNQFAGMTGDPILTVEGLDGEVEMPLEEGGWQIVYKRTDGEGKLIRGDDGKFEDAARQENGTDIGVENVVPYPPNGETLLTDFNKYPHTGEDFYILLDYTEGVHKIKALEFNFRCLTAEGKWDASEGIIKRYKWQCSAVGFDRPCYHDHGPDFWGNPILCYNYTRAYINLRRVRKSDIKIQPFMQVLDSVRGYAEIIAFGEGHMEAKWDEEKYRLIIKFNMDIDLTTTLAGDVWVDENAQKDNSAKYGEKEDGIEKEQGLENVAVTVYEYEGTQKMQEAISHDEDTGERLEWPVYTDENGHYQINRLEAPGGGPERFYVVEFEYDGQVLKHTLYLSTNGTSSSSPEEYKENPDQFEKSSMAVEDMSTRATFDQTFGEITGEESISGTSTTGMTNTTGADGTGGMPNTDSIFNELQYEGELKEIEDSDGNGTGVSRIHSKLDSPYNKERDGRTMEITSNVEDKGVNDTDETYKRYRMMSSTFYSDESEEPEGYSKEQFRIKYPLEDYYMMNAKKTDEGFGYIDEYMLHINLGLKERADTDMSVLKDLQKVTVVVNEQLITKEFNQYAQVAEYNDLLINLEKVSEDGYVLGLYSADVDYQSQVRYINAIEQIKEIKEGTELRVFATYVVRVYNNSDTNDVEINELRDYYDGTFTLVNEEVTASIAKDNMKRGDEETVIAEAPYYRICDSEGEAKPWKPTREENLDGFDDDTSGDLEWEEDGETDSFHVSFTNTLEEIKLDKTHYIEIFTTYEIDQEGYDTMSNSASPITNGRSNLAAEGDGLEKYNVAEIANYSTYYVDEDTQLETGKDSYGSTYYCGYRSGDISGRVDKDSAPNNIDRNDIKNIDKYEDDTYQAPVLKVKIRANAREMWGNVWDDAREEDAQADGVYSGEELIDGVQVTLYEVINLSKIGDGEYAGLDYYYKLPDEQFSVTTGEGGGSEGNWTIKNFLAGDYSVRFDYGDGEEGTEVIYNGQDYQNTKFMANYETTEKSLNIKYYDLTDEDLSNLEVSKARDNESRRMMVDSYSRNIENDRGEILRDKVSEEYIEATKMFAETPVMQVEIEDPLKIDYPEGSIFANETAEGDPYQQLVDSWEHHDNTGEATYVIKNIDFGLEEREHVDLKLEKYIDAIYLFKADTRIFTAFLNEEGKVITDHELTQGLDKATYIGHVQAGPTQQGFFAIAVEDDYMNDLSLVITYKMKIINNSEVDYTGKLANYYVTSEIEKSAFGDLNTTDWYGELMNYLQDDETGVATNNTIKDKVAQYLADDNLISSYGSGDIDDTDTIKPEAIVYGKFVGRYYYTNEIDEAGKAFIITNYSDDENVVDETVTYLGDKVVKTVADQLIDYIDVDTNLDLAENTNIQNSSWRLVEYETAEETLDKLISDESYKTVTITEEGGGTTDDTSFYDDKDRRMIKTIVSNIALSHNGKLERNEEDNRMKYTEGTTQTIDDHNDLLTQELVPVKYSGEGESETIIYITTRKNISSDKEANDALLDNLAEILVYSNPIGRRDRNSIPGNAMDIGKDEGFWRAGYNSIEAWGGDFAPDQFDTNKSEHGILKPENDAYAPEYVTLIPPTGLATMTIIKNNVFQIVGMTIVIIGIASVFIIKQTKIFSKKDKEDTI